ncbi:MAG: hypothetical protein WCI77_06560 [Candidatus Omnitrophota bacterium]
MIYAQALKYQKVALYAGLIFVGGFLIVGALHQRYTGQTYGEEGKPGRGYHVVRRQEMPVYFEFLFFVRLILGIILLLLGLYMCGQKTVTF